MTDTIRVVATTLALAAAILACASRAPAEPGLLLIAHGSPSPEWNRPVLDFGQRVAVEVKKKGRFKAVRTAMLEAAEPNVPTAVAELEAAGCDRIVAVPLFVAPTGHTHFDVPAVLGIYSSPRTAAVLEQDGVKAARPKVPITLTQTLSEGEVLPKYALDQVRKLSKTPKDEALVLLAHGDPEHQMLADRLMRQIATHCCGEAGVGYADWAYIGVGQEYLSDGVAAVKTALRHRKRVLVVGIYVSTSAAKIHQRCVATVQHRESGFDPFRGKDVAMSDAPVVAHPEFLRGVLEIAHTALTAAPTGMPAHGTGRESRVTGADLPSLPRS
jgi:hypothetical protein